MQSEITWGIIWAVIILNIIGFVIGALCGLFEAIGNLSWQNPSSTPWLGPRVDTAKLREEWWRERHLGKRIV